MAIPKPAGPLWDAVSAIHDPWPADDEALAADVAGTWRSGGEVLARGAAETGRAGDAALAAWPDPAGTQYGDRVRALAADAGTLQQRLASRAAHADYYSAALTSTRNAIADTIARNEQAYTRLSDPMLGAAGVARRAEFAASIAADLQGMVTRQADALRGYPVDPDPGGPDDRRPDGGYPIAPPHDYYRELTAEEQAIARQVFGDALDLSQVQISEGALPSAGGIARTLPNEINFPRGASDDPNYRAWLVHELAHVWQYQQGRTVWNLLPAAVVGQYVPDVYAYGGVEGLRGKTFDQFNTEQQAEIVANYYLELQKPRPDLAPYEVFTNELR